MRIFLTVLVSVLISSTLFADDAPYRAYSNDELARAEAREFRASLIAFERWDRGLRRALDLNSRAIAGGPYVRIDGGYGGRPYTMLTARYVMNNLDRVESLRQDWVSHLDELAAIGAERGRRENPAYARQAHFTVTLSESLAEATVVVNDRERFPGKEQIRTLNLDAQGKVGEKVEYEVKIEVLVGGERKISRGKKVQTKIGDAIVGIEFTGRDLP